MQVEGCASSFRSLDRGFVLTTLLGLIAPKGLDTNGTLGRMLGVHPLQLTDHNTGISLLLSTSVWVPLTLFGLGGGGGGGGGF